MSHQDRQQEGSNPMQSTCTPIGPHELRILWEPDPEPYDPGDIPLEDVQPYIDMFGVDGCVIETRGPACPNCGRKSWEHAASLWGIVGDADYHRTIESELMAEVS
jgi:hypothetical protein